MTNVKIKKDIVRDMLLGVERDGMKELVEYLDNKGFWSCPASTVFHGNYDSGLLDHCMNIYNLFWKHLEVFKVDFPKESQIICAFLHDLCKVGLYIKKEYPEGIKGKTYLFNTNQKPGHAELSLERIEKFITLTPEERNVIRFHMGFYGSTEFLGSEKGEYSIKEMSEVYNGNKVAKLFYFCDDMAAQFVDKKQ